MRHKVKELYFSLRHNWSLYLFSIIILALLSIVLSSTFIMLIQTFSKERAINDIYKSKNIFQISDTLLEADDFSKFLSKPENINRIGEFYNALVESKEFNFISTFSQPLYIDSFKGGKNFFYNEYEDDNMYNIKSVQMNVSAYEFYKLKLKLGQEPNWDKIDADDDIIPVILGADYEGIYTIDDEIKGLYYPKPITFKVIGLLEENQSIYYQGNPEFYLDSHILVPYPYKTSDVITPNSDEMRFKGILYFAMVNSNIATSQDEPHLKYTIDQISAQTGFYDHILIGHSIFYTQYSKMITIIKANKTLLNSFLFFAFLFSIVIQISISITLWHRRKNFYKICNELGLLELQNDTKLVQMFPYIITFIIGVLFYKIYAKELVILSIIFISLTLLVIYLICGLSIQLNKRITKERYL